jgi:hypothetical protein
MASPSSSMSLPSLLVSKLALPPSMRRLLCHYCNGNCCSHHNSIIAIADVQACLCCCPASKVALAACRRAGVVPRCNGVTINAQDFCCCCDCIFFSNDDSIVAIVDAQSSLPLSRWYCCPCNNMALLPLIRKSIVALIAMASSLSSSWHHCPAIHCRRLHK